MAGKPDNVDLEQLLSSYIDGMCSDKERQQVEQALQRDPRLRALHGQLIRTIDALRAAPSEAAPSHVRERILSQLERRALIGMPAAAGRPAGAAASGPRHLPRSAWLGLLAAAMLVAGIGATWWYRSQPQRAYQVAMAPSEPPQEGYAAREAAPQQTYKQGVGAAESQPPMGGVQASEQQRSAPVPASPRPAIPLPPQAQALADRAGYQVDKEEAPSQMPDSALAMRQEDQPVPSTERDASKAVDRRGGEDVGRARSESPPMAGKRLAGATPPAHAAAQTPTGQNAATDTAAAPPTAAEALRTNGQDQVALSSTSAVRALPRGIEGNASRKAGPPAPGGLGVQRLGLAAGTPPAAEESARASVDKEKAHLQAVTRTTSGVAPAAPPVRPALPSGGFVAGSLAEGQPEGDTHVSLTFGWNPAARPTVTQLQVTIRDVGRQLALTSGVIRWRVRQENGQTVQPPETSLIFAAVPPDRQGLLVELIKQAPGVLQVQSHLLPASDPLAGQALWLGAQQQWLHVATRFVNWAASYESLISTVGFDEMVRQFSRVPPIVPGEYVALVIDLQPVPAAATEPAGQ